MGVLLMAVTVVGAGAAFAVLLGALYTGKNWLRNFVLGAVVVWFLFYFGMLVGFSLTSQERELGLNEPKAFCGFYLDCHLHTTVTGIRKTKRIGNKTANGEFYILTIKVFSDAKKATLEFGGLKFHVVDAGGNLYPHLPEAEKPEPWFTRQVPAGGSFEREIVFDLPKDVKDPRLDMHDDQAFIEKFLIGDEDSMFHAGTYFRLAGPEQTASVR